MAGMYNTRPSQYMAGMETRNFSKKKQRLIIINILNKTCLSTAAESVEKDSILRI